ncbi:MAG: CDP-glycerol glycerophosphotransferase family protein, partial [candidate division Zixibacteria bacterium]|nr:CDP-glycerol glycerophosphotransferase family protein [candidate division Zixibacteria bacterium]
MKKRSPFTLLLWILLAPVYLISKLIPKRSNLAVFGSSLGHAFADNSKYLYLYARENAPDIHSVFISRSVDVVEKLRSQGYGAERLGTWRSIRTVLRARWAFLSHSTEDIHPVLLGGAQRIQLWHGTPLKYISYDADWRVRGTTSRISNAVRNVLYRVFPYLYASVHCDRVVISSEHIRPSFQSAFRKREAQLPVLGQPRNDCLTDPPHFLTPALFPEVNVLARIRSEFRTIIAWLPTHRQPVTTGVAGLLTDYGFDKPQFEDMLRRHKATFVIKPHGLDVAASRKCIGDSDVISVYEYADPYPLLRVTDVLITDYSSVYFDFLLLNRPIVFTPFDYDSYLRDNAEMY